MSSKMNHRKRSRKTYRVRLYQAQTYLNARPLSAWAKKILGLI